MIHARPLEADDAAAARALLLGRYAMTPYADRALELLERAARGSDPEARALVLERDGDIAGVALLGVVAGSAAARFHDVVLAPDADDECGARLIAHAAALARESGAQILIAELPDEPLLRPTKTLLRRHGFVDDGAVPDYFRDGVPLLFLRLPLA